MAIGVRMPGDGKTIELVALVPTLAGDVREVGPALDFKMLAIAMNDAAPGQLVTYATEGVWRLPKRSAATWPIGAALGWEIEIEPHPTFTGKKQAVAWAPGVAGSTVALVRINFGLENAFG